MAKRLGIVPFQWARPIVAGLKLKGSPSSSEFDLFEDLPPQLASRLRQRQLDGAFLSPIDYAKDYAMYRIVPKICLASEGASEAVRLFFRDNLRTIKTIGIGEVSGSDVVLAHVLMAEKYGVVPQFVPQAGPLEEMLARTDAVLLAGDSAHPERARGQSNGSRANAIDLVDEWCDLTGLPFVHGFWVSRKGGLTIPQMKLLIGAAGPDEAAPDAPSRFHFELDEQAVASVGEFFRMSYYYGVLPDIPDLNFHTLD